jgi:hypothetical protein
VAATRLRGSKAGTHVAQAPRSDLERELAFGVVRQLLEPAVAAADDAPREELFSGAAGGTPRASPGQATTSSRPATARRSGIATSRAARSSAPPRQPASKQCASTICVTTTLNIYTHLFHDARHATEIRTRMASSPFARPHEPDDTEADNLGTPLDALKNRPLAGASMELAGLEPAAS